MDDLIKRNYVYNLISQLLTIFIPVITTPYISRTLGAQAIGDFSYTTGIVSYFCMFAMLGTANYAQREIAKRHESDKDVSCLTYEILIIRMVMISISATLYLIFVRFPTFTRYRVLLSVQIISFVSWGLDITWLYQGLEKFKVTATRNVLIKLISMGLVFIFVKNENDLILYTVIYCISELVGNISMWPSTRGILVRVPFKLLSFRRHVRGIMELFLPNIALQLYTVFDKTMLGAMVNTLEVGYYSQAEKIIKIVLVAISSLSMVLLPRFSYLNTMGNQRSANKYYISAIEYTYFLAIPMTIGCICVADNFVPVFFGSGYAMVAPIMKILSILFIIMSVEKLMGTILIAYNKQNVYTASVIIAAVINVLLNVIFISVLNMNAIGVAIASVFAELAALIVQLCNLPKIFQKNAIYKSLPDYLLSGVFMFLALLLLDRFEISAYWQLVLDIVIGSGVYITLLAGIKKLRIRNG